MRTTRNGGIGLSENVEPEVVGTVPPTEKESIDFEELMRKYDTEARFRALKGWQAILVTAVAVSMSLFHLYTAGFGLLLAIKQGAVHLAFTLALVFLL